MNESLSPQEIIISCISVIFFSFNSESILNDIMNLYCFYSKLINNEFALNPHVLNFYIMK